MKPVILSADGPLTVYMVPDEVADNLLDYCKEFCNKWLPNSPDAAKYRLPSSDGRFVLCYSDADFIEYLNTYIFPDQPSRRLPGLVVRWIEELPRKCRDLPHFNF